jgi:hypothetical protein
LITQKLPDLAQHHRLAHLADGHCTRMQRFT